VRLLLVILLWLTRRHPVYRRTLHEPDESWSYIDHLARLREQGIL
jgi:hypothetical protein